MDFAEIREEEEAEVLEKRPGCLRGVVKLILLLLVTVCAVAALLPTVLSSSPARVLVLAKANAGLAPAKVSCAGWSFGWFTPLRFEGLGYEDPAKGIRFKGESVTFDRGLARLLPVGVLDLGKVTVKRPDVTVSPVKEEPGAPVVKVPKKEEKKEGFFLPVADVAAVLVVEEGSLRMEGQAAEPFVAGRVGVQVELTSWRKPVTVKTQAQVGGGGVALEGRLLSIKDLTGKTGADEAEKLTLTLSAVDLAAFAPLIEAAAGTAWIHSGVAEGALTVTVKGKDQASVEGGVLVNGLSVAGAGQPRSPAGDVALMVDAAYDKKTVTVKKFECGSPWVRAEARGALELGETPDKATGSVQAKTSVFLAPLVRDFGTLLGLSKGVEVQRGEVQGVFLVEGGAKGLALDAKLVTADLAVAVDGEAVPLKPEPSLVAKAVFPRGGLPEVETLHLKLPFADVYGSGKLDAAVLKAKVDLTLFSRDFKRLLKDVPPMVGAAYLDVATKQEDGLVGITSFLKISDLAAELKPGQRLVVPQGTFKFGGKLPLREGKPDGEVRDASFDVSLDGGKVSGGWTRLVPPKEGQELVLRGFSVNANLELEGTRRLLGGFIPASAQASFGACQGRVLAGVTAEAEGGVVKALANVAGQELSGMVSNGMWRVPDVRLESAVTRNGAKEGVRVEATVSGGGAFDRDGETVFAERNGRVAVDVTLAADGERASVSKLAVSSGLLDLNASAEVTELKGRRVLEAKGQAAVDFVGVTQLLEGKGIDEFKMTGKALRDFRFSGPLGAGAPTVLAEGEFAGSVFIASLKGMGLSAGPADASARLSKGVLRLGYEPPLNDGRLRFVPSLDVAGKAFAVSFPPKTRLLENVKVTQEMMDVLLTKVNPLFQGSTLLGGSVTLDLAECRFATDLTGKKMLTAEADMVLRKLKLEMGGTLREVLAMVKVSERVYEVEQLPLRIAIRDSRVHVDPVTMVIDKQPVTFSGSVAFDGSLDYLMELTLTDRLAGGAVGKALKDVKVKIPVTGTVAAPRLDTKGLQQAMQDTLKNAVKEQAIERVSERVGGFLERLQKEMKK